MVSDPLPGFDLGNQGSWLQNPQLQLFSPVLMLFNKKYIRFHIKLFE